MSISLNTAIEHVTKIISSVRCDLCDKYDGSRLRYSCGHSTCFDCAKETDGCLFCISNASTKHPILDEPFTQRVKHSSQLLQSFKETFNIDVFKRHKLSTHLKEERNIFPKCIQAETKYFNKRKSFVNISIGKKKKTNCMFPGEEIYWPNHKMEQSKNVQQWLENNENNLNRPIKKVPLADLDVNTFGKRIKLRGPLKKRADIVLEKLNETCWKKRKQTNINPKLRKKDFGIHTQTIKENISNEIDENMKFKKKRGISTDKLIVISDSENGPVESVFINDTQTQNLDKDKLACLAVKEAEKHCNDTELHYDCEELFKCTNKVDSLKNYWHKIEDNKPTSDNKKNLNVPFYKKSVLTDRCIYCYDTINKEYDSKKNISVLIQNETFTTSINFSKCSESKTIFLNKKSVMVQTEFQDSLDILGLALKINSDKCYNENHKTPIEMGLKSDNVFTNEIMENTPYKSNQIRNCSKNRSNLIINESDSEPEGCMSSLLEVTADVHRSENYQYDEMSGFGVLQQIGLNEVRIHQPRTRMSPTSTDSSDKENKHPNRLKNNKLKKIMKLKSKRK